MRWHTGASESAVHGLRTPTAQGTDRESSTDSAGTDAEGKCPPPLGPNDVHADYSDFIYFDGRSYGLAGALPAEANQDTLGHKLRAAGANKEALGPKLGTVQCQLQGRDTDGYELGSGDASYLDPGTPFFARRGKPTERQIVVDDGRLVLYSVGAKGSL